MAQTTQSQQPLSGPSYDPETDPVLAQLRSHRSSGGGKKALVAVGIVGLLVVGGWYAYSVYDSRSGEATIEEGFRPPVEAEPAPPPPISPLERAEGWCVENLSSSEFAGLPVVAGDNGDFFVLYTARAGDSIGSVVKRYGNSFKSDAPDQILEFAKRQHVKRYGGRGLWVDDEIPLLLPVKLQD